MLSTCRLAVVSMGIATLVACGGGSDQSAETAAPDQPASPPITAATLGPQQVETAAVLRERPEYVNADREYGDRLASQCRACHSFEEGGGNLVGPNLYGMFGSEAGSRSDYAYSPAMRENPFIWTPRALDAWLAEPRTFLPGTTMVFAGIAREADRQALIASLLWQTAP